MNIEYGITLTKCVSKPPPFSCILEPKTPLTSPIEIIDDVMNAAQDDRRHETSKPATTEVTPSELKEKKDKLIQKETVETGSVSFIPSSILSLQSKKLFRSNSMSF